MNLAYKKILGKFTKVLGFGKPPPHVGKDSQIISFFSFDSVPKWQYFYGKCMKLYSGCGNHSENSRNSVFFWKITLPAEVFRDWRDKSHLWDMNILTLVGFIFSCKPLGIEPISLCCKPCRLPGDQFQCTRVDKFMLYNSYLVLLGVFTAVNK